MSVVVPPTLPFGNQQHISQNSSYYGGKSYAVGDCVEGIEAEAKVLVMRSSNTHIGCPSSNCSRAWALINEQSTGCYWQAGLLQALSFFKNTVVLLDTATAGGC